ncbi:hypothetical protein RJ639_006056 [Escallonia herrerae]|uniref:Uncharacterized protein n=1 Tax=Escallonia herrerae TaxID=1293975 RepID=A0AA88W451_9ASTE|nr:hypothetical protein RJ639_006056 [Escallonia herrerae]
MEVLVAKHENMSRYTKSEMEMISKSPVNVFEAAARSKANPLIKKGMQCGGEFKFSDVRRPLMKRQIALSRKRFVVEESSSSEGEERRKGENEKNQARSSQAGIPTSLNKTRLDQSITGSNLRTTSGTCQHFSNNKRSFKRKFLYSDEEEGEEDDCRPPSLTRSAYVFNKKWRLADLVDKDLSSCSDFPQAMRILNLAMMCTSQTPTLRPTMSEVVSVLQDEKTVEQAFGAPPGPPNDSSSMTMASDYVTCSALTSYFMIKENHEKKNLTVLIVSDPVQFSSIKSMNLFISSTNIQFFILKS